MSNAPRPTSLLTKLVCIPLAIILVAFGVAASAIMPRVSETLADRYRSEAGRVQEAMAGWDLGVASEDLAFLLPSPAGSDRRSYARPGVAARDQELFSRLRGGDGPLPQRGGVTPRFAFGDLRDTGSYYFFYSFHHEGALFRAGFPYADYRAAVHRYASRFALVILAVSLIVVLGFPLAFRRVLLSPLAALLDAVRRVAAGDYRAAVHRYASRFALVILAVSLIVVLGFPLAFRRVLLSPLAALLDAVRRVAAGDYRREIPAGVEDEVGRLARGYNTMLASLRDAEGSFKALADNAHDAFFILAKTGAVLYGNPRAVQLAGRGSPALAGEVLWDHLSVDEPGELPPRGHWAATGGLPRAVVTGRLRRSDGSTVPVEISGAATTWQREPADVIVVRDVTERVEAEERLRAQQEKLRQADKMASLGALVAGVVHEVSNPAQVVALDARLLSQGLPGLFALAGSVRGEEEARVAGMGLPEFRESALAAVAEIEASALRIDRIVGELKRFSRGGPTAVREPLDVNSVVRSVVTASRALVAAATRRFSLSLADTLPTVRADRTGLEQVVLNLLQNACQALDGPGRGVNVATSLDRREAAVCIVVSDEGCGIEAQDLPRVTAPFFTTRADRGGTGLGLAVAERIVRSHGGRLLFRSRPGEGTTVTVMLPPCDASP